MRLRPLGWARLLRSHARMSSGRTGPGPGQLPPGVVFVRSLASCCCPNFRFNKQLGYQLSILALTYLAYMCFHLSRRPISIVKNVLHQNCSTLTPPANIHINPENNSTWCDWAPFDGSDGDANALLGVVDLAFLFSYAIAMFISGFIAERVNLRYFLSLGMIFSGIFSYLFGIARNYDIHSITYFIFVQAAAGVVQTTGWPGVVAVVGKWFGKGKRGLIFGVWNSHTSIGNILGALIAGQFVEKDWSLSFIVPGVIIALAGFAIFLFMVEDPANVGLLPPDTPPGSINTNRRDLYRRLESGGEHLSDDNEQSDVNDDTQIVRGEQDHSACFRSHRSATSDNEDPTYKESPPTERTTLLNNSLANRKAISFCHALKIPGVIEFSLSLFFAKLVSYTFLYWLPLYIKNSTSLTPRQSARTSTAFDIGGIVGAILAGVLCDYTGMSATICAGMLFLAAPMMMVYEWFGSMNFLINIFLLMLVGLLVNGPYALITTAVSAELGTHSSLEGNSKALATVTAIIDGTGSIGAALGPMLAALVSSQGWPRVFYMLICCDILALILLLRLVKHEITRQRHSPDGPRE